MSSSYPPSVTPYTKGYSNAHSDSRRITTSSIPAFSLSALFFASAFAPSSLSSRTYVPPFIVRMGFGAIFAGGAAMLASGDSKNGSGVMTSWSLSYLLVDQFARGLTKTAPLPRRHPVSVALLAGAGLSAAVYGYDYFSFEDDDDE